MNELKGEKVEYFKDGRKIIAGTIIVGSDGKSLSYVVDRDVKTHYFVLFQGYAISKQIIEKLLARNIQRIAIRCFENLRKDNQKLLYILTSLTHDWWNKGRNYEYTKFDEQLILPMEFHKIIDKPQQRNLEKFF